MTQEDSKIVDASKMGTLLDGWADLVEGQGSKVKQIRKNLTKELKQRKMTLAEYEEVEAKPKTISKKRRPYLIVTPNFPAARTAVYVSNNGNDLYIAWRTFLALMWNSSLFSQLLKAAWKGILYSAVLGTLYGIYRGIQYSARSGALGEFGKILGLWLLCAISIGVLVTVVMYIIYQKSNKTLSDTESNVWLGLLILSLVASWFITDAGRMGDHLRTSNLQFKAGFSIVPTFWFTPLLVGIGIIIVPVIALFFWGLITKRNALYFLTYQPTLFDADDISATTFTVHKSILRVLDKEGIDIKNLRIKEKFTGGRKGEDI